MENSTLFALWLLTKGGIASDAGHKALREFASFENIYSAKPSDFSTEIFSDAEIKRLSDKNTNNAENIYQKCKAENIDIQTYFSGKYPPSLREISCPPVLIFTKGTVPNFLKEPSLTVVGSRNCDSSYGKIAAKICYELALCGFITVSGIAAGIDTYAHKGTLMAEGKSVAVLPCGLDVDYSLSGKKTTDFILKNGALFSEYPPGTPAFRHHFKQRNRILSGITPATLVVCAEKQSGTMITANYAAEQGKYIFAMPGPLSVKNSEGANELLRNGAILCRNSSDILDEYEYIFDGKLPDRSEAAKKIREHRAKLSKERVKTPVLPQKPPPQNKKPKRQSPETFAAETKAKKEIPEFSDEKQKKIYLLLLQEPLSADGICSKTALSFSETVIALQEMALDGIVEEQGGGRWKISD